MFYEMRPVPCGVRRDLKDLASGWTVGANIVAGTYLRGRPEEPGANLLYQTWIDYLARDP